MSVAYVEVLQTVSSNSLRRAVGAPHLVTKLRRGTPGRIDSRSPRQLGSTQPAALLGTSKEWATVQQAIAGNPQAQEDLFGPHTDRLYRTAFRLLRNKEDAEDALQDGLCKAYISLSSFQGRSSFSTWLTRIVINSALMARRRKSAHPEASLDEFLNSQPERSPQAIVDAQPDPEKLCAATEISSLVEEHVRQLPPALQTAFRLRSSEGLSAAESSQALGISTSAFKSRICRARHKLARSLRQPREAAAIALVLGQ
jgi:RNA polymerase sigma factor (sigma-70 family)